MRLIDADAFIENLKQYFIKFERDGLKTEIIELAISDISEVVDNVPTVDTEPIVRCKDCKYWSPTTVETIKDGTYINQPNPCEINFIGNKGEWRTADDFCSRGEAK